MSRQRRSNVLSFCKYLWSRTIINIQFILQKNLNQIVETVLFLKLAANQLLIVCYFKDFSSSTRLLINIRIISHCYQSFCVVVEVYLKDIVYILFYNALNPSDLLSWVKGVTSIDWV
jgi:hypothetical protein